MKIISWKERYPERTKDALDLHFIMHKYADAGNRDRLYGKEQDLLLEENFDVRHAGIRLLGQDMARIADHETLNIVRAILDTETDPEARYNLVIDMMTGSLGYVDRFDEILMQVEKLKRGLSE
jgi:predicted nucleotidyltransferase